VNEKIGGLYASSSSSLSTLGQRVGKVITVPPAHSFDKYVLNMRPGMVASGVQQQQRLVHVAVTVRNTHTMWSGDEVVQCYVQYPDTALEPVTQLRDFHKVSLAPGEEATLIFTLYAIPQLAIWDAAVHAWTLPAPVGGGGDESMYQQGGKSNAKKSSSSSVGYGVNNSSTTSSSLTYTVYVGSSSRDFRVKQTFQI
jgi:hypothetical protein